MSRKDLSIGISEFTIKRDLADKALTTMSCGVEGIRGAKVVEGALVGYVKGPCLLCLYHYIITMGRAFTLSLHERGRIKALSTAGNTVKQIVDVSSGRLSKFNDLEKREILRTASYSTTSINEIRRTCGIDASESTVQRMLNKSSNIVRSRMKKYPELTQAHKNGRLCFA
uniref:HTH_Tnp_Tc3_2 domain-containing protein n=1 Tax=Heterorhabditis bacteriophora TaxID=37862 RepID=A0A1I7XF01_HETBA